MNTRLIKDVLKTVLAIVGIIILCRLTKGFAAGALVLYACFLAMSQKKWVTLAAFVIFPYLIIMNPGILPKTGYMGLIFRVGTAMMSVALLMGAMSRSGGHRIPLGGLVAYLVVATVSSMGGYCPSISFMKEVNFLLFLLGVWIGTRNLHHHVNDLYRLRCVLLALCVITVFGSCLTLPFPAIAYPQTVSGLMQWSGMTAEEAALVAGEMSEQSFLAGVTNHSNAFAPLLACSVGFLLCDMLFVERRFTKLHGALIVLSLPLMYFTKSRGAFVTLVAVVAIIYFYGTAAIPTRMAVKTRARNWIVMFVMLVGLGAAFLQAKDGGFSKYLRKDTADNGQNYSLSEAMTASRMGLVESNLNDFKKNPMFGMGFQTSEIHPYLLAAGIISMFSAPIEKGVLPTMVLGETGLVGAGVFLCWAFVFISVCRRKNYVCTLCLMGVLQASNLGEASFFSPGGVGGILWIVTVVGGYICDMQIIYRRFVERQMRRMFMAQEQAVAMVR